MDEVVDVRKEMSPWLFWAEMERELDEMLAERDALQLKT